VKQHVELTISWICPSSNNWESPTYLVDVDDEDNEGAGYLLKEKVWNAVQVVVEEWTGQLQTGTSIYGVRTYTSGAILSPHVDRYRYTKSEEVGWIAHSRQATDYASLFSESRLYQAA
jgi:hypothetical protein